MPQGIYILDCFLVQHLLYFALNWVVFLLRGKDLNHRGYSIGLDGVQAADSCEKIKLCLLGLNPPTFLVVEHNYFLCFLLDVIYEVRNRRDTALGQSFVLFGLKDTHQCPYFVRHVVEEVIDLLRDCDPAAILPSFCVQAVELFDLPRSREQLHDCVV